MKRTILIATCIAMLTLTVNGQRRAASYPFEFSKGFLAKKNYNSYFLQDANTKQFMLVLRDNEKADYILYDEKVKKITNFSPPNGLKNTIFSFDDADYLGGAAGNGKFHFVYKVTDRKFIGSNTYYQVETVDPAAKTITNRQLFEIPKDEKLLISFGNFGQYFSITANNKSDELSIYGLNASGESFTKKIKVTIPSASKQKKLTDYLENIRLVTEEEEPGLETAVEKVKIFHSPGKLSIVVNEDGDPTQIIDINTNDFSVSQKAIDHSGLAKEEKGKVYISSFLKGDKLFALILNKKDIKVAVYNVTDGSLINNIVINDDSGFELFAILPTEEERYGKRANEKDINSISRLIKTLTKGSEGLTVTTNKTGQFVLTVGTYDPIKVQTGETGGHWQQTSRVNTANPSSSTGSPGALNTTTNYINSQTYVPGSPVYTTKLANYYRKTQFILVLDDKNLKIVRGKVPESVTGQIKDYLADVAVKADATNQFKVNDKQFFGYYSHEDKLYIIEEIAIRK